MPEVRVAANDIAAHGLVITGEVTKVVFETNIASVDIISDGKAAVFYTVNGSEPEVNGSHTYVLPAFPSIDTRPAPNDIGTLDTVQLVSDGEATVSIQVG